MGADRRDVIVGADLGGNARDVNPRRRASQAHHSQRRRVRHPLLYAVARTPVETGLFQRRQRRQQRHLQARQRLVFPATRATTSTTGPGRRGSAGPGDRQGWPTTCAARSESEPSGRHSAQPIVGQHRRRGDVHITGTGFESGGSPRSSRQVGTRTPSRAFTSTARRDLGDGAAGEAAGRPTPRPPGRRRACGGARGSQAMATQARRTQVDFQYVDTAPQARPGSPGCPNRRRRVGTGTGDNPRVRLHGATGSRSVASRNQIEVNGPTGSPPLHRRIASTSCRRSRPRGVRRREREERHVSGPGPGRERQRNQCDRTYPPTARGSDRVDPLGGLVAPPGCGCETRRRQPNTTTSRPQRSPRCRRLARPPRQRVRDSSSRSAVPASIR